MSVSVPNQWSATFTQPAAFGTTPPALPSPIDPMADPGIASAETHAPVTGIVAAAAPPENRRARSFWAAASRCAPSPAARRAAAAA